MLEAVVKIKNVDTKIFDADIVAIEELCEMYDIRSDIAEQMKEIDRCSEEIFYLQSITDELYADPEVMANDIITIDPKVTDLICRLYPATTPIWESGEVSCENFLNNIWEGIKKLFKMIYDAIVGVLKFIGRMLGICKKEDSNRASTAEANEAICTVLDEIADDIIEATKKDLSSTLDKLDTSSFDAFDDSMKKEIEEGRKAEEERQKAEIKKAQEEAAAAEKELKAVEAAKAKAEKEYKEMVEKERKERLQKINDYFAMNKVNMKLHKSTDGLKLLNAVRKMQDPKWIIKCHENTYQPLHLRIGTEDIAAVAEKWRPDPSMIITGFRADLYKSRPNLYKTIDDVPPSAVIEERIDNYIIDSIREAREGFPQTPAHHPVWLDKTTIRYNDSIDKKYLYTVREDPQKFIEELNKRFSTTDLSDYGSSAIVPTLKLINKRIEGIKSIAENAEKSIGYFRKDIERHQKKLLANNSKSANHREVHLRNIAKYQRSIGFEELKGKMCAKVISVYMSMLKTMGMIRRYDAHNWKNQQKYTAILKLK